MSNKMKINIIITLFLFVNYYITHSATDLSELDTPWTAQTVGILQKIQKAGIRSREKVAVYSSGDPYDLIMGKNYLAHAETHGVPYDQIIHHRQLVLEGSIETLSSPRDHLKPSDPKNTHWHLVWVTNPDAPHTMPYLEGIASNIKKHQDLYTFHLWSNAPLDHEQLKLQEAGAIFQYHPIKDISKHMDDEIVGLLNRLIEKRYYTFACDILRSALVHYHGNSDDDFNVYTDLGFLFRQILDPRILRNFNQGIGLMKFRTHSICFLDIVSGFFIGRRGNKATEQFFLSLGKSLKNPEFDLFQTESNLCQPYPPFFCIPSLMVSFTKIPDEESRRTLYVPLGDTELVKWSHMGSWAKGSKGQINFRQNPITSTTFFGELHYVFTKDWIPLYSQIVWEYASLTLKDIPHLKALEVGSWEGRDTVHIIDHLLTSPDATLDVVDWWKPYQAAFNARGGYHRFLNNTEKAFDDRKLIITRDHPRKILPLLKQQVVSGKKTPYHFIHLRFLHTQKEGYAATLQDAFSLLCSGGLLLTPCNTWAQEGYDYLKEVAASFLDENHQHFDVLENRDYLCLRKK